LDSYHPEDWRDFFLLAGTASAALAGLVFVAITLHLRSITAHPGHRHRARTVLASLGHILIASLVMLIPIFDHVAAGSALVAAAGWLLYETIRSSIRVVPVMRRWRRDPVARTIAVRTAIGDLSMIMGFSGAFLVLAGAGLGLVLVALDMIVRFALAVAGSWLLVVAVAEESEVPTSS
jgi:modulator of FtsH protease